MSLFSSWDGNVSSEITTEVLRELALLHLERVCNPAIEDLKNDLQRAVMADDYHYLCNYDLDYSRLSPLDAINIGQVLAFYKKRSDLDLGIDKRRVARDKFMESETRCRITNHMFRSWASGGFQFLPDVESALHAARRKIAEVLGDVPALADLHLRFGPGASTQVPKRKACAKVKLSQQACCSEDLLPLVNEILEEVPQYTFSSQDEFDWSDLSKESENLEEYEEGCREATRKLRERGIISHGSSVCKSGTEESLAVDVLIHPGKLEFVPKNAKTDRAIMVEPWLNSIVQLAVGDYMARRLKAFGVDLTDQERNKSLAREGSLTGALATLDLSSASDSISTGLVEHLLPPDWFDFLLRFRTGVVVESDGSVTRLQKFSSMGNGFTFPLESLVFWALTRACCNRRETVSVYGDDIICPTHRVDKVLSVLTATGFLVNQEKSFWTGPFRESCGGDYLSGIDVRPCFIKGPLTGHDMFRLHNFYMRDLDRELASVVRKHIDDSIALLGPDGFGDGVLVGYQWDAIRKSNHLANGYGGVVFESWCYKKRNFKRRLPGDRVLPSYSIYTRECVSGNDVATLLAEERRFLAWLVNQDPDMIPGSFESEGYRFTKDGVPENYLPGTKGCKRISIYTFQLP
ncbi:RNA-directed RNA polymerase [ssRNA phage SRR5467090_3]|uniref:RNA-directed RNA polymerase n=1 Tax=ssRNA phage SRR5467090_3 TaxID=2786452 RepID=A0A8S5L574_9VIRU|nr:RNA-directed RNA polymerase [ssRNA phage SRR5467090_3]DAD52479.1 TPA_asm: RNA-directed RNA polymerase [ssRNA phage SRR5467090_3]